MWSRHGEKVVLHVPVERLVMQGALRYADTASHPFLRALDEGASALQAYYAQRQPRSFCEFYGVSPTVAADEQVPCWELPWLHRLRRVPPPGEAGLGAEHGVSYYGPASPRKVEVEYQRLASLKQRVLRMGYLPEVYGHIVGFFMLDDAGEYRFFVRGGQASHRGAGAPGAPFHPGDVQARLAPDGVRARRRVLAAGRGRGTVGDRRAGCVPPLHRPRVAVGDHHRAGTCRGDGVAARSRRFQYPAADPRRAARRVVVTRPCVHQEQSGRTARD